MTDDPGYEYQAMVASSWDLLRGDTSDFPDRQFYRDIVHSSGEPILDVGCGTGRLLLEYLADGLQVEGVDVSPEMIAICRKKALEKSLQPVLYVQAIENLDLPHKYCTIIVPSCTFQLVTDPLAVRAALAQFYKHLLSGGMLAMSIWHIMDDGPAEWSDWYLVAEKERPEDGKIVRRHERSMYYPKTQLRHTENRYELLENDRVVYQEDHRRSPELRDYTLAQIAQLLEQAGYEDVQAVSGYSNEPATEEDRIFNIMGRKV